VRNVEDLTHAQRLVAMGRTFVVRHEGGSGQSPTKMSFANEAQETSRSLVLAMASRPTHRLQPPAIWMAFGAIRQQKGHSAAS
jgi:hypothetical protein